MKWPSKFAKRRKSTSWKSSKTESSMTGADRETAYLAKLLKSSRGNCLDCPEKLPSQDKSAFE
jgi:hypothetical protein